MARTVWPRRAAAEAMRLLCKDGRGAALLASPIAVFELDVVGAESIAAGEAITTITMHDGRRTAVVPGAHC